MLRSFYTTILGILLLTHTGCRTYTPGDPLEKKISLSKLDADFDIFRAIIESAHPSLYSYLTEKRASFLFDSIFSTMKGGLTLREYYNKLSVLTSKIGCSHSNVSLPDHLVDTLYNRKLFFPVPVVLINKCLLANSDYPLPHGTEIISINNTSSQAILNNLAFYNPVDGFPRKPQKSLAAADFGFQYYTWYGGGRNFNIVYKDTLGEKKDTVLTSVTLEELSLRESGSYYFDATDVPYFLTTYEQDGYALLRITTFDFDSWNSQRAFESFLKNSFELLKKKPECKTLVIDIRENTGGYLYGCFLLFSYLAREPFKEYKSVFTKIRKLPYPDYLSEDYTPEKIEQINDELINEFERKSRLRYTYSDSLISVWQPDKNAFRKSVYIITNARVLSAASYFCTLVKNSGYGKIVGVETAGSEYSGNGFKTLKYNLPYSGIKLVFPYAKIIYTKGSPKNGRGLIPDYNVPDTDSSFMNNSDAQLLYIKDSLITKKGTAVSTFAGNNK